MLNRIESFGSTILLVTLVLPLSARGQTPLTLDRLYSLPRLIGTAPEAPTWSADSRRFAFLWNDRGLNFKDIWLVTLEEGGPALPIRLTQLSAREPSAGAGSADHSPAAIESRLRLERDPGVVALVWHPDNESLLFELGGDLYFLRIGATPTLWQERASRAAFSPSGRWVAFLRDGDLWIRAVEGADSEPRPLVQLESPDVSVASFRFSPDGARLVFEQQDRRRVPLRGIPDYLESETTMVPVRRPYPGEEPPARRLGVIDLAGGEPRLLSLDSPATDPIFGYRWSPDGRLLVDRSDLYVKHRRILAVDPERRGSETAWEELYREDEPLNVTAYWQAEWGGDGIYFLSDRDEDYHIYHLPEGSSEPRRITRGGFAVAEFTYSEPAGAIFYLANAPRPEERQLFRVDVAGGEPIRLSRTPGTHQAAVSPDGRWAAVLVSNDQMPTELFLTKLTVESESTSETREQRLTRSPLPEFDEREWVSPEYVEFESHIDGSMLHGRLMLPPNLDRSRRHPVIVGSVYSNTVRNQWGGRNLHPLWGLEQYLLQEGYILFTVDFRGSWGRGREHRRGIRLDYGGIDVEDIYSGVLYLKTLGYADMDRVGIWGSSYGGLLTCMSLFRKPGVYRAGVAGAPATNVFHALTGEMRVMMSPEDETEAYVEASAFSQAAGMRDRLMIIHGMRDRIVLYKDSVALVDRLLRLGKDVDFVTLPSSGHGWDMEDLYQTRFAFKKLVDFFERHLGKGPR